MKIALQNLRAQYGDTIAVANLNLDIADGELFCLIGPSGCGKTTTLRMVAGLMNPTGGTIHFGDRLIADPGTRHIVPTSERNLGMVFQSYALWPHLTVAANVGLGLKVRRMSPPDIATRIDESLALVGLTGKADRYPNQLSGGQQQRVALARAVALQPGVLLFDEPLSNLDAALREEMREEIRNLQRRIGITAIYVTHDQTEALAISDRIGVMHDGNLVQCGAPEQLYRAPANPFVAGFLGHANILFGRIESHTIIVNATQIAPSPDTPNTPNVTLMIRPEALSFDGPNPHPGRITKSTYLGKTIEYFVTIDTLATTLRIHEPATQSHRSGTQMIAIDPSGVVIVAGAAP
jgi:ABC-type Fe3+/spermidine/putrescine transport system ATPase subunit